MKRIYFNEGACQASIRAREQFYARINEFGADLKKEGVVLTPEILGRFMNEGISCISALLAEAAVQQFERLDIKMTSVMRAGYYNEAQRIASEFQKHLLPLRQAQHNAHISWSEANILDDGHAVFSDPEKKEIEKKNTVFLKKESEPLYEKLVEIAGTINQAAEDLKKENLDLFESLKIIMSENSYVQDENFKLHPRPDVCLLLNRENKIEVNPVIFG